jgi:DNA repair protein REV1
MGSRLEAKSSLVRKRIESHTFSNEDGEEYGASDFGGFAGYFRRKKIKLQNLDAELRAQSSDNPQIFKGIVCHVNGYTQPGLSDLHALVVRHGGGFLQYLDGKTMVTHIIASQLTPKKKEEFRKYRIVKPAWIVDSVNAGRLLPWDHYRVVDEGVGQKVLGFGNGQLQSQANRKAQTYKEQTDQSWYTSQLRGGTRVGGERVGGGGGGVGGDGGAKKPVFTRTVTPDGEEIGDEDEFPMPEITSSVERALERGEAVAASKKPAAQSLPSEVGLKTVLKTPPPSSPPLAPLPEETVERDEGPSAKVTEGGHRLEIQQEQTAPVEANQHDDQSPLQLREGSQEPDYSMSVVRNSDKLRSVSPSKLANMTAEEHNALLLSDPKIRKSTVVHPDFLEQYYRESRLHHLSTWKAELKSQLQALAAEKSSSQKAKPKRLPGQRRYTMHVDFDSFFAAVSLKKHPHLVDRPCVVAHGQGSGSEIASCNYPARKFGIKNGMWMRRAQDLCPELKILPYDFPAYEEASRLFYDAILSTGGVVQSVSIDEALIDISSLCFAESGTDGIKRHEGAVYREQKHADDIAQSLRDEVLAKTGCNVSVGIGGNILLAKVALRKAKPAGQYQLKPEDVLDFIGGLEVQDLPGVAWSIGGKLEDLGIKLVKDIREASKEKLIQTLGPKTGEKIWDYARGIDRAEVGDQVIRRSVSAEVNWGVRFSSQEQVDEFMHGLCGELEKRLLKEKVKGRQLTMKVMKRSADAPLDPPKHLGHGKCDTYTKSLQLGVATNDKGVLTKEAMGMLRGFGIRPGELRGIGVQMQRLEPVKGTTSGAGGMDWKEAEGRQKKLAFKPGGQKSKVAPAGGGKTEADPIQDDITPTSKKIPEFNKPSVPVQVVNPSTPTKKALNTVGTQFVMPTQVDPVVLAELPEDIRTRLARHDGQSSSTGGLAQRPPSPTRQETQAGGKDVGTQFILPTQVDPAVVAELPGDIRRSLMRHVKTSAPGPKLRLEPLPAMSKSPGAGAKDDALSRPQSVGSTKPRQAVRVVAALPSQSQIDPRILEALPEDVRAEIQEFYNGKSPGNRKKGDQAVLPQSPRKTRTLPPTTTKQSVKRKRGGGLFTGRPRNSKSNEASTLTQSNFVARPRHLQDDSAGGHNTTDTEASAGEGELDPEFLAALPEDIRKEVIEQQRRTRLHKKAGLDLQQRRKNTKKIVKPGDGGPAEQRVFRLPPRPARPTFTQRKLTSLPELRDAVKKWYTEFSADSEKPYGEDVNALAKYLRAVVLEERDLGKAVQVVDWLGWMIDSDENTGEMKVGVKEAWRTALERVKEGVREAGRERRMGVVDFG